MPRNDQYAGGLEDDERLTRDLLHALLGEVGEVGWVRVGHDGVEVWSAVLLIWGCCDVLLQVGEKL
jgi:hypothetical protein